MKRIILTGGGTAGHVTPNIALLPRLKDAGYGVFYIGSVDGMEKKLIEAQGIPYYGIATGKLRRYFDLKNFTDPFRVIKGFTQAMHLMKQLKPDVVFSKGGFVSVPVVIAAGRKHIPVICHESDLTPGLGSREAALKLTGFSADRPVLMVMGGSLGATAVNKAVRDALPELLKDWQIIHLCGKGKLDESLKGTPGYLQFEYVQKELPDLFALCDLVISRAGANAICELLALKKPTLLIPLSAKASRGDQILNARSFERQGFSMVLEEEELTTESLLHAVSELNAHRADYIHAMEASPQSDAIGKILQLREEVTA